MRTSLSTLNLFVFLYDQTCLSLSVVFSSSRKIIDGICSFTDNPSFWNMIQKKYITAPQEEMWLRYEERHIIWGPLRRPLVVPMDMNVKETTLKKTRICVSLGIALVCWGGQRWMWMFQSRIGKDWSINITMIPRGGCVWSCERLWTWRRRRWSRRQYVYHWRYD